MTERKHTWMGLGLADMSQAQADEWTTVRGNTDTPLGLHIRSIICFRCDQPFAAETLECPGRGVPEPGTSAENADARTLHHWTTLMTIEMSEQEVMSWDEGEGLHLDLSPHSIALVCALCGQPYDEASAACPERAMVNMEAGDVSE